MVIHRHLNTTIPILVGNILLVVLVLLVSIMESFTFHKEIIISSLIIAILLVNYKALFTGKANLYQRACPYPECKEKLYRYEEKIITKKNKDLIHASKELVIAKEAAEQSERLQSAFLANISHEIRTPMNAIIGFSQLLTNEEITSDLRKAYVEIINQNSNYLLQVIDDILSIAKIESGRLKPIEIRGSVSKLFQDVYESFTSDNSTPNLRDVKFVIKNKLGLDHDIITTDFIRLKQVLNNLIVNAFKFTRDGFIEMGCKRSEKGTLLFYIKDSGIGIPKEQHERIFQRFRQGEDTFLTKEYKGTGLGLTISKRLIELMKGEIWVESDKGHGATFYFTIPYKRANKPVSYE